MCMAIAELPAKLPRSSKRLRMANGYATPKLNFQSTWKSYKRNILTGHAHGFSRTVRWKIGWTPALRPAFSGFMKNQVAVNQHWHANLSSTCRHPLHQFYAYSAGLEWKTGGDVASVLRNIICQLLELSVPSKRQLHAIITAERKDGDGLND
jgi:hypothetical protein